MQAIGYKMFGQTGILRDLQVCCEEISTPGTSSEEGLWVTIEKVPNIVGVVPS